MRQQPTRLSYQFRIAALAAILAVLVPVVMPVCAMAHEAVLQNELPCHEEKREVPPCHEGADSPDAATELECCTIDVAGLHEEAIVPEAPPSLELLAIVPILVIDAAPPVLKVGSTDAAQPPAGPPVILPILFRSLLN